MATDKKNEFVTLIEKQTRILSEEQTNLSLTELAELYKARFIESQAVSRTGSWDWNILTDSHFHSDQLTRIFDLDEDATRFEYQSFREKMPLEDRARLEEAMNYAMQNKSSYDLVFQITTRTGEIRFIHGMGRAEYNEAGEPIRFYGTAQDVTRETVLEKKLIQNQRMEAVGSFAAGIARDFNNILQGLGLLLEKASASSDPFEMKRMGSLFQKYIDRGEGLIRKILIFTRTESVNLQSVKFCVEVLKALELIRATIPARIKLETRVDPLDGFVLAADSDIHQCVVNLFSNAVNAIGDAKGVVQIQVGECDTEEVSRQGLKPARYVALTVSDTGRGIPDDAISRIYDPFFTAGNDAQGTGLGLAVVMKIVTRCKGDIRVSSEVGKGTTFKLYFPRTS